MAATNRIRIELLLGRLLTKPELAKRCDRTCEQIGATLWQMVNRTREVVRIEQRNQPVRYALARLYTALQAAWPPHFTKGGRHEHELAKRSGTEKKIHQQPRKTKMPATTKRKPMKRNAKQQQQTGTRTGQAGAGRRTTTTRKTLSKAK